MVYLLNGISRSLRNVLAGNFPYENNFGESSAGPEVAQVVCKDVYVKLILCHRSGCCY